MEDFALPVNVLVEGTSDEAVIRRLLAHVGLPIGFVYGHRGKEALLAKVEDYNHAAHFSRWVVLVDLDADDCAPPFVNHHLQNPAPGMRFRVAVHAVEAWLLADVDSMAAYLGALPRRFPHHPDAEEDPKTTLVQIARKGRKKSVCQDIVPEGSGRVGPGYTSRIIEFSRNHWNPTAAASRSDSLRRCIEALQSLREWRPS
ncbi:MAG: hypothetical protein JW910_15110 [Anaerolineae bacterium]|nr:hypothetical protein [Anaerolineae bacterium]